LPTQTRKGFVYFRRHLDINDTVNYPVGTYGPVINPAQLATYTSAYNAIQASDRSPSEKLFATTLITIQYMNVARVTAMKAAFPGSIGLPNTLRATDSLNNDISCDMVGGNWCKFITQYNQFGTSTPHWRVGAASEFLGRYGSSITGISYFSTTLIGAHEAEAIFTIYYYDGAIGTTRLNYYNGVAGTITTAGTGVFLSVVITVPDFRGGGLLPNSNDFSLEYVSGAAIIFGLLKLEINA
jgi:hypothetical protein